MRTKFPVNQKFPDTLSIGVMSVRLILHNSSLIQTLLSVLESHQISCQIDWQVADYTAGWELHPTPKNFLSNYTHYIPISFFCTDTLHPYKLFSGNKKTRRISPFSSGLLYKLILASANKQRF